MKIKGPLLSIGASGSIGNVLTFSKRKTHQHARSKQGANKKLTPKQTEWRLLMDFVSLKWQSLTAEQKESYSTLGKAQSPQITGFQYLAHVGMLDPATYLDLAVFSPLMYATPGGQFINYADRTNNFDITEDGVNSYEIKQQNTRKNRYYYYKPGNRCTQRLNQTKDLEIPPGNFTISFFYDSYNYADFHSLLAMSSNTIANQGWYFYQDSQNALKLALFGPSTTYLTVFANTSGIHQFNYVTVVDEGTTTRTYCNGKLTHIYTPGPWNTEELGLFWIFRKWYGAAENHQAISDITILKRALSFTEVKNLYNAQKLNIKFDN